MRGTTGVREGWREGGRRREDERDGSGRRGKENNNRVIVSNVEITHGQSWCWI